MYGEPSVISKMTEKAKFLAHKFNSPSTEWIL